MDAGSGLNRGPYRHYPGAVAGDARQVTLPSPAPVAVHDDGDVSWKPLDVELTVNLGLFAVQSCGNCCVQGYLSFHK